MIIFIRNICIPSTEVSAIIIADHAESWRRLCMFLLCTLSHFICYNSEEKKIHAIKYHIFGMDDMFTHEAIVSTKFVTFCLTLTSIFRNIFSENETLRFYCVSFFYAVGNRSFKTFQIRNSTKWWTIWKKTDNLCEKLFIAYHWRDSKTTRFGKSRTFYLKRIWCKCVALTVYYKKTQPIHLNLHWLTNRNWHKNSDANFVVLVSTHLID